MSNGWLQRTKDGTLWRVENPDVYQKALKEGFVAAEPPEVTPMVHVSGGASVPLSSVTLPSGAGTPGAAGAAADAQGAIHVAQAAAERAETAARALEAERRIAELERQIRERDEADALHAKNTSARTKFSGASPAR